MKWVPHVTVATVLEREQRFLFVEERIDGQRVLNQPAGHWEQGETLVEAAVRETLEETAWHFQAEALVGIYQWTHPHKALTYLRFCFCGQALREETGRPLDTEIEQVVWLSQVQLEQRKNEHRSPLVMTCLRDYLAGQRYPLTLLTAL